MYYDCIKFKKKKWNKLDLDCKCIPFHPDGYFSFQYLNR